jgi:hypothetical protein
MTWELTVPENGLKKWAIVMDPAVSAQTLGKALAPKFDSR